MGGGVSGEGKERMGERREWGRGGDGDGESAGRT
jgi:hypothetical protein